MYDYSSLFYMDVGDGELWIQKAQGSRVLSPYDYSFNNPIRLADPEGNAPSDIVFVNNRGFEVHRIKNDTQLRLIYKQQRTQAVIPQKVLLVRSKFQCQNIIQNKVGGRCF